MNSAMFWRLHPPLFVGIFFLAGGGAAFGFFPIAFFFGAAILIPLITWPKMVHVERIALFLGALAISTTSFFYTRYNYPLPVLKEPLKANCYVRIESVRKSRSPFSSSFLYEGKAAVAVANEKTYYNLPIKIYLPLRKKRPKADSDYWIQGALHQKTPTTYLLKPTAKWQAVEKSANGAERRYQLKQKVKRLIRPYFPDDRCYFFISGLLTGELEDGLLAHEFGKLGLSHLLAISGFHFALIALFFSLFLKRLFSERVTSILLIALTSAYFIYLGGAPSVTRAWSALLLLLFGTACGLQTKPLNALGFSLILLIFYDPILCTRLGFGLSYLATFALLRGARPIERALFFLFPQRSSGQVLQLPLFERHIALASHWIRKGLSLTIAVTLFTLPLLLATFHKFPLLSLFYNLLIPSGVSVALFCSLWGLSLLLLHPTLAKPFFSLSHSISHFLLDQIEFYPRFFDLSLYSQRLSLRGALTITLLMVALTFLDKITDPMDNFVLSGDRSSVG